jgi:rhodanese-related sulfurtransferase
MNSATILILLCLIVPVIAWFAFEGWWDRRLFRSVEGRLCRNAPAMENKVFLDQNPDTQVLDVRSASEFKGGALPGAVNNSIGDSDFAGKIGQLDRERPVLVYCAGGYRSRNAVEVLKRLNFTTIQHLHRGYHSWKLAGLPVTKSGG